MTDSKQIVVGYDGSTEAKQAVTWAARQAVLRGCQLHLVHCSLWILVTSDLGPVPGVADSGLERAAERVLEEGLAVVKEAEPSVDVTSTLLHGMPRDHMGKLSVGAEMLVLGSRGLGGFLGLLVGSVSLEMAATASCPVAVIRSVDHPEGPVVVAIDDAGSPEALEDACTMASVTGADLKVVHVVPEPAGLRRLRDPIDSYPAAEALVDSAVRKARELAPQSTVTGELQVNHSVARAILQAAPDARIVVVGTKGRGLIKGTIGSTAHAVLHHAPGPVLVSRRNAG
ncbi:universal stress protein [Paenarthrobacter ureafaciens]|uniref:universal stress protein n=1 Tax=Paenarthrobacter TaxID=1742992 RepID=UPI00222EABD4|nr:universal stress protein [Paenarthrobacter sp. PAE-2]MCW3768638.1 universal stress protein [Paenarthrobacter sp. PAE-2]